MFRRSVGGAGTPSVGGRTHSVRTRIVWLSVLAAVLAIGLFGVPLAAIVVKYSIDDERNELERVADVAAVSASVDLVRGEPLSDLPRVTRSTTLGVYGPDGRRIGGAGPPVEDRVTARARGRVARSTDEQGNIVVAVPMATDTGLLGMVRASTPRTEPYQEIGLAWLFMAGLAAVAVVVTWLVARSVAARMSRPLERLAVTAHALGGGDFSTRFEPAGITEIDTAVAALNSTASRLSDLVARERAFSADASHQLRTPLTALRLGLEVALDDPAQDLRETVAGAITDTDRLQRTIEDLLALARDSMSRAEPLDLTALLAEAVATWSPHLEGRGRALLLAVEPDVPTSRASAAAVRQILTVLLDNASTHGAGTVLVTVRGAGRALAVDVADQGPPLTVPGTELFARRAGSAAGHGIGLALARRLAEAEGGRLRLSCPSPPTFTLLIPPLERGPAGPVTERPAAPAAR
jgi:signal transduction histidine kinase